jgi:hypothetical protein
LIGDDRTAVRRTLRLGVPSYSSGELTSALILNISERGLLIETAVRLAVGDTLLVDIPEASGSSVRVIWTDNLRAGCEFVGPVSTGAVSAARLKSPLSAAGSTNQLPATGADSSAGAEQGDPDGSSIQTAITIVIYIISVVALIIFLAAILVPS